MSKSLEPGLDTSLSLAVQLIDDFTKKPAIGKLSVLLDIADKNPVKNNGGFFTFLNTDTKNSTQILVRSNYYFSQDYQIDWNAVGDIDPNNKQYPLITITLKPLPSYPFSRNHS